MLLKMFMNAVTNIFPSFKGAYIIKMLHYDAIVIVKTVVAVIQVENINNVNVF